MQSGFRNKIKHNGGKVAEFSREHKHNFSSLLAMFLNNPVNPRDEVIPSSVVLRAGQVWNKLFARALCVDWASIELKWFGNIPTRQLWPKCNSLFLPKPAPGLMFAIVVSLCARVLTLWAVYNPVMVWRVWQRGVHWVISQLYLGYEGVGPKTIITQLTNSWYLYHTRRTPSCIGGVSAVFTAQPGELLMPVSGSFKVLRNGLQNWE